jgi:hypothetical protein
VALLVLRLDFVIEAEGRRARALLAEFGEELV